jgi:hypothetical protein
MMCFIYALLDLPALPKYFTPNPVAAKNNFVQALLN